MEEQLRWRHTKGTAANMHVSCPQPHCNHALPAVLPRQPHQPHQHQLPDCWLGPLLLGQRKRLQPLPQMLGWMLALVPLLMRHQQGQK